MTIDFTKPVVMMEDCYCGKTPDGTLCEWCEDFHECKFLTCPQCKGLYDECPCPGPYSEPEEDEDE